MMEKTLQYIVMKNGIQKFKGRMDNNILEMFRLAGESIYCVKCKWNGKNRSDLESKDRDTEELAVNIHRLRSLV